jgi:two-component system, NarL family, response regulator DegU
LVCSKTFEFVGQVSEASDGLELIESLKVASPLPDVVLLDLRMPVMDGVEATDKIRELFPELKIIILTMRDDESLIVYLIEKGINGYLLKDVEPEELERALLTLREEELLLQ